MKTKLAQRKTTTSRLTSYLFGFGSGLLVAVLYGAFDQSATEDSASDLPQVVQAPASDQKIDRIDWSFYDLFPNTEVTTVTGYQRAKQPDDPKSTYHLQAGSFSDARDADERRAELLLLGLTVFVVKKEVKEGIWYRVMIGPFQSETYLNRAQSLLAANDVSSIPITGEP
jgi:cell division protein FtsN